MAAIFDFWVRMTSYGETDIRIGFPMVDLPKKVFLYMILGALVQKLIFQDGGGGHLGFLGQNDVIW